jgi:hypothetical protein
MDRRDITRIMLEGLLNGIGFVIGSAIVGLVVSVVLGLTHHPMILAALSVVGVVMWLSFRGRRFVKARLERVKIEEFGRALGRQWSRRRAILDALPRRRRLRGAGRSRVR